MSSLRLRRFTPGIGSRAQQRDPEHRIVVLIRGNFWRGNTGFTL